MHGKKNNFNFEKRIFLVKVINRSIYKHYENSQKLLCWVDDLLPHAPLIWHHYYAATVSFNINNAVDNVSQLCRY